jgi:hypothetical protein
VRLAGSGPAERENRRIEASLAAQLEVGRPADAERADEFIAQFRYGDVRVNFDCPGADIGGAGAEDRPHLGVRGSY